MKTPEDMASFVGRRTKLDDHRLFDAQSGELLYQVTARSPRYNQSEKSDRYYRELADNNPDYFSASKQPGSIDDQTLLIIAERNLQTAHNYDLDRDEDGSKRAEIYELAASALHEAAFCQTRDAEVIIDDVDARLDLIDQGNLALLQAIEALGTANTTLKQRLRIKLGFNNVHKDMACGELTDDTVGEVIAMLESELYATYDNIDSRHARGLGGEIRSLLEIWTNYQVPGDVIALPATVRGDSGLSRRDETHDIDRFIQDGEKWQVVTPLEVKRRKLTQASLARYDKSDVVYVSPTGSVTLVKRAKSLAS